MIQFLMQWRAEWHKLLARKRTYIGFIVFLVLELVLLAVFHLQGVERVFERMISRQGEAFEEFFSGLTLGYIMLRLSVFLLGGLYLTLVAGDIVAKEGEDGHLRLLLARPISRMRLLLVKYLTCTTYAIALVLFIATTGLIMGIAVKGWGGGLFAMAPELGVLGFFDASEGLKRYFAGAFFLGLAMTTVSSAAFCLSCMPIKPAAATIAALSYVLVDMILRESGIMESYDYLLITGYIANWGRVFAETIEWAHVIRSYAVLMAANATFFLIGAAVFEARDLKS